MVQTCTTPFCIPQIPVASLTAKPHPVPMGSVLKGIIKLSWNLLKKAGHVVGFLLLKLWQGFKYLAKNHSTTFGSAQFAKRRALKRAGLFNPAGLIAGRLKNSFLYFTGQGYMLVSAKSRSGKGWGIVIPNLLNYQGSTICNDIKGENYAITARHRKTLGAVYKLDLENPLISAKFNPLDTVRFGSVHMVDDAVEIAELMHLHDPRSESHWDDKSAAGIACLILYVIEQNLNRLSDTATQGEKPQ